MRPINVRWIVVWLVLAGMGVTGLDAQCPQNAGDLYHLEEAYESGGFYEILDLEDCVRSLPEAVHKRRSQRSSVLEAEDPSAEGLDQHGVETFLHIFAKTAVAADRPELATLAVGELRKLNPRYRPNPDEDPHALIMASDSIIPYSSNLFGISGGPSWTLVNAPEVKPLYYGLDNSTVTPMVPDYRNRTAYSFGLEWQHFFRYRHGFVTGLTNFVPSFVIRQVAPGHTWNQKSPADNAWQLEQNEALHMLQVPLLYQYRLCLNRGGNGISNWLAFQAGGFGQLLVSARSDYEITKWELQEADTVERTHRETLTEVSDRRVRLSMGLQSSVSLQMETYGFAWYVRLASQIGITQLRKPSGLYNDTFLTNIWEAHLVDNNFRIHSLNLTLGFLIARGNRIQKLGQ